MVLRLMIACGTQIQPKINELLFRFRSYSVALVADIKKAFLMISVDPNDHDVLRFLWVEDSFDNDVKLVTMRFTRVVFGVSSSPFLLNATIKHHLEVYQSSKPKIVESLSRSTCHDICCTNQITQVNCIMCHHKTFWRQSKCCW